MSAFIKKWLSIMALVGIVAIVVSMAIDGDGKHEREKALGLERQLVSQRYEALEQESVAARQQLEQQERDIRVEREQFDAAWAEKERVQTTQAEALKRDRRALRQALAKLARVEIEQVRDILDDVTMPAPAAAALAADCLKCQDDLEKCDGDCALKLKESGVAAGLALADLSKENLYLSKSSDTYKAEAEYWKAMTKQAKADEIKAAVQWGLIGGSGGVVATTAVILGVMMGGR